MPSPSSSRPGSIGRTRHALPGAKGRALARHAPKPPASERQAPERHALGARFGRWREPFSTPAASGPLSGAVVAAVLELGQDRRETEDGLFAIRLGTGAADPQVRLRLGWRLERARRLTVLWDPAEDQIVRVSEDRWLVDLAAPAPRARTGPELDPGLEDEDGLWRQVRADPGRHGRAFAPA